MKKFRVKDLGKSPDLSYDIVWDDSFDRLPACLAEAELKPGKICIITDSNVGPLYEEALRKVLETAGFSVFTHIFPAGEEQKNYQTMNGMYRFLIENGFDRKDMLVALGGGVTGDMTGFCAATYLRGIAYIQVPTTLLAQVDSSVGGKTAIDFDCYKNMIGAFYQPRLVYMNISTLKTLPDDQFASGMGEVIKTGLLRDKTLFCRIEEHKEEIRTQEPSALISVIRECCRNKAEVVEEDPTEKGVRATLNLGHTLGHAIEKCMNFSMTHGACVGVGTIAAAYLSERRGLITENDLARIEALETYFDIPSRVTGIKPEDVVKTTRSDKKMEKGKIKFILLEDLGRAVIDRTVTEEEMLEACKYVIN
ncbi:MAG: 3-dehydroquinate synthase [Eubacterium sp.]|nr:3-dehydroquinate synthase [Eubacterium sp.]